MATPSFTASGASGRQTDGVPMEESYLEEPIFHGVAPASSENQAVDVKVTFSVEVTSSPGTTNELPPTLATQAGQPSPCVATTIAMMVPQSTAAAMTVSSPPTGELRLDATATRALAALSAVGLDVTTMPSVVNQLIQLSQNPQEAAAKTSFALKSLQDAGMIAQTSLTSQASGGQVPAAVQTVVLATNGAQQGQIASANMPSVLSKLLSPLTITWLTDNFEVSEGMSLPRVALYSFYVEFCQRNNVHAVNAASFGKIIRQVFPAIKTRRLGTRGQSKYHYYGIGVKASSPYHSAMVTAARRQAVSSPRQPTLPLPSPAQAVTGQPSVISSTAASSTSSSSSVVSCTTPSMLRGDAQAGGTLQSGQQILAGFPDQARIHLPAHINPEDANKIRTFLVMYRAHCISILEAVVRNNFSEVENFIRHFWQGLPKNMCSVLDSDLAADLVGKCDSVLSKAVIQAVMPSTIQPLTLSLTHAIRQFAKQLHVWIVQALANQPEKIRAVKLEVAHKFTSMLRRRTSVSHLAQATHSVLASEDSVLQMLQDYKQLDLTSITYQCISTFHRNDAAGFFDLYVEFMMEFEDLLEKKANIQSYCVWLETVVDRCVVQPWQNDMLSFQNLARLFLLRWQFFTTRVVRDLTLRSAPSFGSYHLLNMLFVDYILHLVETQIYEQQEKVITNQVIKYFGLEGDPVPPPPITTGTTTVTTDPSTVPPVSPLAPGPTSNVVVNPRQTVPNVVISDGVVDQHVKVHAPTATSSGSGGAASVQPISLIPSSSTASVSSSQILTTEPSMTPPPVKEETMADISPFPSESNGVFKEVDGEVLPGKYDGEDKGRCTTPEPLMRSRIPCIPLGASATAEIFLNQPGITNGNGSATDKS